MKRFYLFRGLPGSGKSELAEAIAPLYNVAADDYEGLYVDGIYNQELQAESHQWCLGTIERWMEEERYPIAVHNTFMQKKYYLVYLIAAAYYGYSTQIVHVEGVLLPDGTQPENIHNVPQEVIERMSAHWQPFKGMKTSSQILAEIQEAYPTEPERVWTWVNSLAMLDDFQDVPEDFRKNREFQSWVVEQKYQLVIK